VRADSSSQSTHGNVTRAAKADGKLKTRLSKGEKRNRKRIAEVGAVYDATPAPRGASDVLPAGESERQDAKQGPRAKRKWLTASVTDDAAQVVCEVFEEAERRDPDHARPWVALVDGNNHQIDRIEAEATEREIDVTILVDLVHVLEYLWKAAWCFHREGDRAAEQWVSRHAQRILAGGATKVAGAIRRQATKGGLDPPRREGADKCATYLTNKAAYLDYPTALRRGWPIATGVIEGACRHLVKDRMGPHRRPLGARRRRGDPQATRHPRKRRLRRILALPPQPRTPPRPPLPLRRQHPPTHHMRPSLQGNCTPLLSSSAPVSP